jgi:acyl dehydratase
MLIGSLFSTLVGMYCPGEKCLYVSQSLKFKEPVFYDDNVIVKGTVESKNDSVQLITIKTEIVKDNVVAISGNAIVRVL